MENEAAIRALAALAQPTRLDIFRTLVQAGPSGRTAGELVSELGIPPSSASFHFKELARAGLIDAVTQSRFIIYSVRFAQMEALIGFLTENCCQGDASCRTDVGCADHGSHLHPAPPQPERESNKPRRPS